MSRQCLFTELKTIISREKFLTLGVNECTRSREIGALEDGLALRFWQLVGLAGL